MSDLQALDREINRNITKLLLEITKLLSNQSISIEAFTLAIDDLTVVIDNLAGQQAIEYRVECRDEAAAKFKKKIKDYFEGVEKR